MSAPPVPVKLKYQGVEAFMAAYCKHPEVRGLFIETSVPVPAGTALELTVEFAPGKGIKILARVLDKKSADGGVFVTFEKMPAAYQQWFETQLQQYRTQYGIKEPGEEALPTGHELRKAQSAEDLTASGEKIGSLQLATPNQLTLGIDLGTSNSCATIVVDGTQTVIKLQDAGKTIPSVVQYDDSGAVIVGQAAKDGLAKNPRRTVFGAKRFIGRDYESPAVQNMLSRFPYKVVPGPGGRIAVDIDGRPVALTAISAKILAEIKKRASEEIGQPIEHAIITVPAYYNDNQRNAVVQAGRLAGLQIARILNEPTAAAIAYGLTKAKPRRLIIYDLGGGTFDVSVMSVHRNSLQVLATAGDTFLGGEDFDEAIVAYVVKAVETRQKLQLSRNAAAMALIKEAAEKAKRRVSGSDKAMVTVREAVLRDGSKTRLEVELKRETVEKLVEPLVARTLKICDMALREAKLETKDMQDVILVGGQSRMPYVQERVREHFDQAPRCDLDPDEVVAMGAGMLPALQEQGEEVELKDVLSMSIGIAVRTMFKPLIPRNTPLPVRKHFKINVPKKDFEGYQIDVWQGESQELFRNEHLGTLKITSVDPGYEDPVPIRIDFMLTEDCLLKLKVTHLVSEQSEQVLLNTRDAEPT